MICDYCQKRRLVGHKVSHSNIKTKMQQHGNIHKVRVKIDGQVKSAYACTRCQRSGWVVKAV